MNVLPGRLTAVYGPAQSEKDVPKLTGPVTARDIGELDSYCISLITHARHGRVDGWRKDADGSLTLFADAISFPGGDMQELDEPCMYGRELRGLILRHFGVMPPTGLELIPADGVELRDGMLCRVRVG